MTKPQEIIAKRYKTKNFDLFEEIEENRNAESMRGHQKRIGESMERHGFMEFRPLLVIPSTTKGKFKVIDGQNRLREAKRLDKDVIYEIIPKSNNQLLIDLQTARDWTSKDYMHNYVIIGESESIKYVNWLNSIYPKANCPIIACLLAGDMSNGSATGVRAIKTGKVDMIYKDQTTNTLLTIKELSEAAIPKRIKDELWKRSFIKAMFAFHMNGEFDRSKMIEKMQSHHTKLVVYNRPPDWFNHLEEIYNISARSPIRFKIRAGGDKRTRKI